MKNVIQMIGLITLICFSFFYTDKVMTILNEQDPIMLTIMEVKEKYKMDPVEAIIKDNTIIPGIIGKEVDVENSYNNMKQVGIFKDILLSYNDVYPLDLLVNNYDKYIISGNKNKQEVSIIFTVTSNRDLDNIIANVDNNYNINLFIDYRVLSNNLDKIKNTKYNIYSYGNDGVYNKDILTLSNNLIEKNFNKSLYCLGNNDETINICKNKKMNTINSTYKYNDDAYNGVKNNLSNGIIMQIENNKKNLEEFSYIYRYIYSKGLKVVSLEQLLGENK